MKLPPLNALRAFEAAARTGSFTSAGKELGVSSAAVSQQVRKLEEYLGRKVFLRRNNQLLLTDAGRDLYLNAATALADISRFTQRVLQPSGRRALVISALPSLAERWLPVRLTGYGAAPVRMRVEEDPIDMEAEDVDVRLAYGGEDYAGFWVRPLFHDTLAPMAAPGVAEMWDSADGWAGLRAIEMDWGAQFSRTPTWADWCGAQGVAPPVAAVTVPGAAAALRLAEAGVGVALGQVCLAREALAEGRLVQLSDRTIPMPDPYVVVVAHARLRAPRIQSFLQGIGIAE